MADVLNDGLPPIRELDPVHAPHAYSVEYRRLNSRAELAATVFVNEATDDRRLVSSEERQLKGISSCR